MLKEQTNYVPRREKIIVEECPQNVRELEKLIHYRQIFLACATVDFCCAIDATTLAVSLSIIGAALSAGGQTSWIANSYFM